MKGSPVLDYVFPASSQELIPADHAYALYGALCKILPYLHRPLSQEDVLSHWQSVGILPINGIAGGHRAVRLTHRSVLTIRAAADLYRDLLRLAGARLDLGSARVALGIPRLRPLSPAPKLISRLVIIKGFLDEATFLEAARRQLRALGVQADVELVHRRGTRSVEGRTGARPASPYVRRTVRIRNREVVGYALRVENLDPPGSLLLQTRGIGGRRKLGCGIFLPLRAR